MKPIIRVFVANRCGGTDVAGIAVAEDGDELANHVSSSIDWLKADMGVDGACDPDNGTSGPSRRKHDLYAKKYPDGFEVRWVEDWQADPFLVEQAKKNAGAPHAR